MQRTYKTYCIIALTGAIISAADSQKRRGERIEEIGKYQKYHFDKIEYNCTENIEKRVE